MKPSPEAAFRPSVVLVEDEALIRMATADALSEGGFDVLEAGNAAEALAVLKSQGDTVCILLTDIQMPGAMDGLELAHRAHNHWPWIKLVLTSGRSKPEPGELPSGSRFVPKPYSPDRMVTALRDVAKN